MSFTPWQQRHRSSVTNFQHPHHTEIIHHGFNHWTSTSIADQTPSSPYQSNRELLVNNNIRITNKQLPSENQDLNNVIENHSHSNRIKRKAPWEKQESTDHQQITSIISIEQVPSKYQICTSSNSNQTFNDFSLNSGVIPIQSECITRPIQSTQSWKGTDPQYSFDVSPIHPRIPPWLSSTVSPTSISSPHNSNVSLPFETTTVIPPNPTMGPEALLQALETMGVSNEELEQVKLELSCPYVCQMVSEILASDSLTSVPDQPMENNIIVQCQQSVSSPAHLPLIVQEVPVPRPIVRIPPPKTQRPFRVGLHREYTRPRYNNNHSGKLRNQLHSTFDRSRGQNDIWQSNEELPKHSETISQDSVEWIKENHTVLCPNVLCPNDDEEEEGEIYDDNSIQQLTQIPCPPSEPPPPTCIQPAIVVGPDLSSVQPRSPQLHHNAVVPYVKPNRRVETSAASVDTNRLLPTPSLTPFLDAAKNEVKRKSQFLHMTMNSARIAEMVGSLTDPFGVRNTATKADLTLTLIVNIRPGLAQLRLSQCTVLDRLVMAHSIMEQLSPHAQAYLIADSSGSATLCIEDPNRMVHDESMQNSRNHQRAPLLFQLGKNELNSGDVIDLFDIDTHWLNDKLVSRILELCLS